MVSYFSTKAPMLFNGERKFFSVIQFISASEMIMEQSDIYMGDKKKTLGPYFILYIQVNLKWVIDLNAEIKTIKLIVDNIGKYLCNPGIGKDFLGRPRSY